MGAGAAGADRARLWRGDTTALSPLMLSIGMFVGQGRPGGCDLSDIPHQGSCYLPGHLWL
jgi:hypothetical protein